VQFRCKLVRQSWPLAAGPARPPAARHRVRASGPITGLDVQVDQHGRWRQIVAGFDRWDQSPGSTVQVDQHGRWRQITAGFDRWDQSPGSTVQVDQHGRWRQIVAGFDRLRSNESAP